MSNAYKYTQVGAATATPRMLNRQIVNNVIIYLVLYANTSIAKTTRLQHLEDAATILEHIVSDFNDELDQEVRDILYYGFLRILEKTKIAIVSKNELVSFKDEIGFLNVLIGFLQ